MSPTALEQEDHSRDAAFNKAMHGKSAQAQGGMRALFQKDTAAQKAAVDEYFKHWDNKSAEVETEETRKVRPLEVCARPVLTWCRPAETNTRP
jgi:sterol 24-C-methyltransferase